MSGYPETIRDLEDDEQGRALKDFIKFYLLEFCTERIPEGSDMEDNINRCVMDNIRNLEGEIEIDLERRSGLRGSARAKRPGWSMITEAFDSKRW